MKKVFSKIVVALVALTLVFSLAACNKGEPKDANKLTMWVSGQWTGTDLDNLNSFINDFNEANPLGFEVEVIHKSDMELDLGTSRRNGSTPDLLLWDRFNTPTYSKKGYLHAVDDLIARDSVDTTKYHPEAMKEMVYNADGSGNKTYGLPLDLDAWGIYVNTDMVDAYNTGKADSEKIVLANDWTWNDLYDIAKKLTKIEGGKMTVAGYSAEDLHEHYFKYMVSTGTEFIVDNKTNFDNNAGRDVLKFFKKLKDGNVCTGGMTEKSAFTSGILAMVNNPTYYADYIRQMGSSVNYKFMPQPRYCLEDGSVPAGSVNGGMIGGYGLAYPEPVKKYQTEEWSARLEKAWKFTKWWLTEEANMQKWSETSHTLPAMTSLQDSDIVKNTPVLAQTAAVVQNYKIRPQVPGFLLLQTNVINQTIPQYLTGSIDLDTAIRTMKDNGNLELSI